jgi:hypothetical protein
MVYFYQRGMELKSKGGKAELIDASLLSAAAIAAKVHRIGTRVWARAS